MSEQARIPSTVDVVTNLIAGRHDEVREVIDYYLQKNGQALGMRDAVWVSEELPEEDPAEITKQVNAYPWLLGSAINDVTQQTATVWPVESLYTKQSWPTKVYEGPVFILSGEFDPWTPPAYGVQMTTVFPQAKHVVYPEGTHLPGFQSQGTEDITSFMIDHQ